MYFLKDFFLFFVIGTFYFHRPIFKVLTAENQHKGFYFSKNMFVIEGEKWQINL